MISKEDAMRRMIEECYDQEILRTIGKTQAEALLSVAECAARHQIPPEMFRRIHEEVVVVLGAIADA